MRKKPDITECPCCGNPTTSATPRCLSAHGSSGELAFFELHWVCNACGCEWTNGQFDKQEGEHET